MSYYLSPALVALRSQINAHYPRRDKASDGWIGDTAHQSAGRVSDHNPATDSTPRGMVRAIDVDEDLVPGGSTAGPANQLVSALITDPRVAYVIYEGRIWQNPTLFPKNPGWRKHTGVNSHAHHVHVSVRRGATWDRDESPWPMPGIAAPITPTPVQEDDMYKDDPELRARLDQIVAWQQNWFKALEGQAEQNRNLLAEWTQNRTREAVTASTSAILAEMPNIDLTQERIDELVGGAVDRALADKTIPVSGRIEIDVPTLSLGQQG